MQDNIQFIPKEDMQFEFIMSELSEKYDWGLTYTHVSDKAHSRSKGDGVRIAVLDTGISHHIDLDGNIENILSAVNDDGFDKQGHGTHVSGICAGLQNGVGIIGVAPEAKIVSIKVLDNNGSGNYESIEKGIRMAIEQKVDIINMSLGAPQPPPEFIHQAIVDANNAGIIIVSAAGNDAGSVNYPAAYPEVIAVAAIDSNGNLTRFSSKGERVAAVAPGLRIYSTFLNNQYAVLDGTSQASPFMAGVCALLLSWSRKNPNTMQIKNSQDMLKQLDELCDPKGRIVSGRDSNIGFGIPNFANYMPWK